MAKYTKKWNTDFVKRYTNAIKVLSELEKEYKEMVESNPDKYISTWVSDSDIEFGEASGYYVIHYNEDESESYPQEHINISFKSELGMFSFNISDFGIAKTFRNDVIEAFDKMQRPEEKPKITVDDEEEDLEDLEYTEYTVVASRSCVHSWSHTVMARSSSEALRLVEDDPDGSTHDNNDDYDGFGEIEYEIQ